MIWFSVAGILVMVAAGSVSMLFKIGTVEDYQERYVWALWRHVAWRKRVILGHWLLYLAWVLVGIGSWPSWGFIFAVVGVVLNTIFLIKARRLLPVAIAKAQAEEDRAVASEPMPQNPSGLG